MLGPALRHVRPVAIPQLLPSSNTVLWLPGTSDPQSGTIRDRSGNGNNGTFTGATWTKTDRGLPVVNFDGTDDIVLCGSAAGLISQTTFTLLMWLRVTSTTGERDIMNTRNVDNNNGLTLLLLDTSLAAGLYVYTTSFETTVCNTAFTLNRWHHFAITKDGASVTYFIDGAVKNSWSVLGVEASGLGQFQLGAFNGVTVTNEFIGQIGLVVKGNRIWSASEITQNYNLNRHLFGV